jgi:hypothetical protein
MTESFLLNVIQQFYLFLFKTQKQKNHEYEKKYRKKKYKFFVWFLFFVWFIKKSSTNLLQSCTFSAPTESICVFLARDLIPLA